MIYFKNKENIVFAYYKNDIAQTERLTELEQLIAKKEPDFIDAKKNLAEKKEQFRVISDEYHSLSEADAPENEIKNAFDKANLAEKTLNDELITFNAIEKEYYQIKSEYELIFPIFFEIRENLKSMKKMTAKEVDAYLKPPVSKEQLVVEAEQKKQLLLSEVAESIAPLQDAVDLGIATDEEKSQLTAWKTYRVYLNRVNTSTALDIEWPVKP
ncbi:tail fiber assembly protein [Providencia rettgeri]